MCYSLKKNSVKSDHDMALFNDLDICKYSLSKLMCAYKTCVNQIHQIRCGYLKQGNAIYLNTTVFIIVI